MALADLHTHPYHHFIVVYDAFRYFVVAEGAALLVIGGHRVWEAWVRGWPRPIRTGLVQWWVGLIIMVSFQVIFTVHRLHHHLNWYTPVTFIGFTISLTGIWKLRSQPPVYAPHPVVLNEAESEP